MLQDPYGIGPIQYMGLSNKEIHKNLVTAFNRVVLFMVVLRDQSHAYISVIYGTGPMHVSQVYMGPIP